MIVTTNILREKYKDYANPLDKIKREVDSGRLFRINRGIYETNRNVDPHLLAAALISVPSYLSFEFALEYYGFIPERVYLITSATCWLKKNRKYKNIFASFSYSDVPVSTFSKGLTIIEEGEYLVKIASKEKAICDSLYKWPVVHSVKELKILLFDDKRIDEDEFASCNFNDLLELAPLYKSTNLNLLIKLIRKEYLK